MSLLSLQSILESIGLKEKEVVVYLANLKIGTNTASIIAKTAGLERSTTYSIIEKLKRRGYIMEFKKSGMNSYTSVDPRKILNYLKYQQSELGSKINEFAENMEHFDKLKTKYHLRPAINLLEGKNSIIQIHENMLTEMRPIKTILSVSDVDERLKKYFRSYTERRICKKIPVKILAHENALKIIPELIKKEFCEIRLIKKDIADGITVNIYGNKIAMMAIKEEFAVLIENNKAAETLLAVFDIAWNTLSKRDPRYNYGVTTGAGPNPPA